LAEEGGLFFAEEEATVFFFPTSLSFFPRSFFHFDAATANRIDLTGDNKRP
jgi:hypothetical protein